MTNDTNTRTVDLTPTWEGIMPLLIEIYMHAETPEGRQTALDELSRMARAADAYVEACK